MTPLPDPPADLGLVRDEPMSRHTYIRLGGPAAFFATPADLDQLAAIVEWARSVGLPVRAVGGGSNLLVADVGIRAVVVSLRRACGAIEFGDGSDLTHVHVGAAVMLPALARAAAERDLGGLEFAVGIPGAVGGALQTNAGIGDGRCIGDLVRAVEVMRDGVRATLPRDSLEFDYRHSSLRGSGAMVLGAMLALTPRPRAEIDAEMRRLLEARQRTQPTAEPNAGSMFRNPPGDAAGRLIEAADCKGLRRGGAQVSTLHANFIVHDGTATASDVCELMAEIRRRVQERSGIDLLPEVEWWGDGERPPVFRPG